jgi:maltose alpha-D-glucosyltransferase/alpha-amylase
MQWDACPNAGFSDALKENLFAPVIDDSVYGYAQVNVAVQKVDPNSLLNQVRHMIAVRKNYPAFGWGEFVWQDLGSNAVTAYSRRYQDETILVINNLSDQVVEVALPASLQGYLNVLDGKTVSAAHLSLAPYQYLWLQEQ